jgi:hypothetical protein
MHHLESVNKVLRMEILHWLSMQAIFRSEMSDLAAAPKRAIRWGVNSASCKLVYKYCS